MGDRRGVVSRLGQTSGQKVPQAMGKRRMYLSQSAATELVLWALPSSTPELCPKPKAAHACGVGVGAFASRTLAETLKRLKNRAASLAFEIELEKEYTKTKLLSFIGKTRDLNQAILASADILAKSACREALGGEAAKDAVGDTADALLKDFIEPFERLLINLPQTMGWDDEDPPKARRRIRDALRRLKQRLQELADPDGDEIPLATASRWAERAGRRLGRDWADDQKALAPCKHGGKAQTGGKPPAKPE